MAGSISCYVDLLRHGLFPVEGGEPRKLPSCELLPAECHRIGQECGVVLRSGCVGEPLDRVQSTSKYVVVHDSPEGKLLRSIKVEPIECRERLLHVSHRVRPELCAVQRGDGPGVREQDIPRLARDRTHRFAPAVG